MRMARCRRALSGFGFATPFRAADRNRLATLMGGRMAAP